MWIFKSQPATLTQRTQKCVWANKTWPWGTNWSRPGPLPGGSKDVFQTPSHLWSSVINFPNFRGLASRADETYASLHFLFNQHQGLDQEGHFTVPYSRTWSLLLRHVLFEVLATCQVISKVCKTLPAPEIQQILVLLFSTVSNSCLEVVPPSKLYVLLSLEWHPSFLPDRCMETTLFPSSHTAYPTDVTYF